MANLDKKLRTRIAQKWDLVENWERSELKLLKGELAIDELNRIKIGTGDKSWNELPFAVDGVGAKIQEVTELPAAADGEVGNLAIAGEKLYCLVPDEQNGKKWTDLTNAEDIASLNAALVALKNEMDAKDAALVALKNDVDAKDAAHDAALIALQNALSGDFSAELDQIRSDVSENAEHIGTNRADLDAILNETDSTKIKTSALPSEIYDSGLGKITASALPSFVDDVVEGIVCLGTDSNETTYRLTHSGDSVVGFFASFDPEVNAERQMKFVAAQKPSADEDLGSLPHTENNITYKFPQKPAEQWIAPNTSTIYVDVMTNKTYRWSGSQFVVVASDLALGETSSTAFAGSRGLALEKEVYGDENADPAKIGLITRTETLESALQDEAQARADADRAHDAALAVLQNEISNFKSEAEEKHAELENEIASSIVALKQESEQADAAHEASLVALQQQIDALDASTSAMTLNEVLSNSTSEENGFLNSEVLVFECGDAEAPAINPQP